MDIYYNLENRLLGNNTYRFALIILYWVVVAACAAAQTHQAYHEPLAQNLASLRSGLLKVEYQRGNQLSQTLRTWEKLEPSRELLRDFIFEIYLQKVIGYASFKSLYKKLNKKFPYSAVAKMITEEELESILANPLLVVLIINDILEPNPPNKLRKNELLKELDFYQLSSDERIAEVGAGEGVFSLILSLTGLKLEIWVNELRNRRLKYAMHLFDLSRYHVSPSKAIFVKGSKTSTNISQKMDKVIVRNTMHHFTHMQEMLRSIKNNLNTSGSLFIMEWVKSELPDSDECRKSMTEDQIRDTIANAGFKIKREHREGNKLLLQLQM